jgi:hypothetical protein
MFYDFERLRSGPRTSREAAEVFDPREKAYERGIYHSEHVRQFWIFNRARAEADMIIAGLFFWVCETNYESG